jgi:hypothetical protein
MRSSFDDRVFVPPTQPLGGLQARQLGEQVADRAHPERVQPPAPTTFAGVVVHVAALTKHGEVARLLSPGFWLRCTLARTIRVIGKCGAG